MTNVDQLLYILFGWLLGLFSPTIINAVSARHRRKKFLEALSAELVDVQIRLLVTGFQLGIKYGSLDREYLVWLRSALSKYKGDEELGKINEFADVLVEHGVSPELVEKVRIENEGVGLSLKTYSTSYLDSNLAEISGLSPELQVKIHEFRNCMNVLNQESERANDRQLMTWDGSISSENHKRLVQDISARFTHIHRMSVRASKKIEAIETAIR